MLAWLILFVSLLVVYVACSMGPLFFQLTISDIHKINQIKNLPAQMMSWVGSHGPDTN